MAGIVCCAMLSLSPKWDSDAIHDPATSVYLFQLNQTMCSLLMRFSEASSKFTVQCSLPSLELVSQPFLKTTVRSLVMMRDTTCLHDGGAHGAGWCFLNHQFDNTHLLVDPGFS